jgi:acetyl-CoA C-acetyltransferase
VRENTKLLPENTPVLVGAGQIVERNATDSSHMTLASQAATNAIADTGADIKALTAQIDTICVTRLFSDSNPAWACKWGRSDNPPESVARAINASPLHRIYSHIGGNEPQSRLLEFAKDIAAGKRSMVLLTGAEAIKNQRHAERQQRELDWQQHFDQPLEDRGLGDNFTTSQELNNGLINIAYYYALIEQAQRQQQGRTVAQHKQEMATLLASFSAVAANNPYAQFSGSQTVEDILAAPAISNLYSKRMIAQDGVNQGAALLLCSLGKARELGIAESNYVYLHGMAEGSELALSERADPSQSLIANKVADRALEIAGVTIDDIDLIDIYSCFPCAITAIADHLGLPVDGSRPLTLTGGLPYFGGAGNNYSMHALAEAVSQARQQPNSYAMVTANGGILSKHASGIYSCLPSTVDWASTETTINNKDIERRSICSNPSSGTVVSYTVYHDRKGYAHAIILAKTEHDSTGNQQHFVAMTAADDKLTAQSFLEQDPTGMRVKLSSPQNETLYFTLENSE